jgi:3-oxoacyl-[acyl-carrier protein] reductase
MHNVIVTGGSRGLGLAITTSLAAAGYQVIAVARSETDPLREAMSSTAPGSVCFRAFDLTETAAMGKFVRTLRREFGPIYGLVNNAGIGTSGLLTMMRDDQIERLAQLNTIAPMILTKYVLRSMLAERVGRIINIASVVAATGYKGLAAYAATKASMIGFTRSLAREVGSIGITVNAVAPGFIDTEMTRGTDPAVRERIMRRSALKRLPVPADVAGAVEYLLSDKASKITGITLTVDAGNTA